MPEQYLLIPDAALVANRMFYGYPHIRLVRSMLTLGLSRKGMRDLEAVGELRPPSEIQLTQSCGSQVFPS